MELYGTGLRIISVDDVFVLTSQRHTEHTRAYLLSHSVTHSYQCFQNRVRVSFIQPEVKKIPAKLSHNVLIGKPANL